MSADTIAGTGAGTDAEQTGIEDSWRALLVVGIALAVMGILAAVFPLLTGVSIALLFGAALVVGGFFTIAHAFSARRWTGFVWQTILAVVYAVAGILVLANPVLGLASLTVLLVAYLVSSGIVQVVLGLQTSGQPNSAWLIVGGGISLLVAVLLFLGLPSTATWAIGLLFGVHLLATGISMIMVAMGTKKAVEAEEPTPPTARPGGV
ncbi:HdeD family acid-resistance protein [Haloarchaeobius amylolyticus]|uniref:HdeD family acid-resistance protein n=1 Tax=Haloarchaeobius amylolyticus TaxID=1198296 RepID=UPI00226D851B|nr:HdeD family acid-resistance protein [Haloarchaeobius amylolyticus]